MHMRLTWPVAIACAIVVAGCGGTTETPILGTGSNPRVRAINLVPSSPDLSVSYDNFTPPIGTASALQPPTAYSIENEGNHTVNFESSGSTIASFSGLFRLNTYYTVAVAQQSGNYRTFAFADNGSPTGQGLNQLRVANILGGSSSVDVYVTPGSSSNPTLTNANLVKSGVAYGTDSGYKTVTPGQYTVTITALNTPSSVLFNQTVSVNADQAETLFVVSATQSVMGSDDQGT